jgi:arabinogalactan oligomer/maltooligosaccharide transport system substrate-binding protein
MLRCLLVLTLPLLFAGCGKKPAADVARAKPDPAAVAPAVAPTATTAAPPVQPVTVKLWHSYRDDERKALESLTEKWNRDRPESKIDLLAVPYDAIIDKFQVAVPRGNGPDLVVIAHDKIGAWVRMGLLQPLGEFATPERLGRFLPQTVRPLVFEKACWGLPLAFKSLALFYNKKLVPTPPTTMTQLIEVGKGFTRADDGAFGLAYDAGDLYFHAPFLHATGGAVYDDAARKLTLDTPEARKALEVARALLKTHGIVPKGLSGFVITAMFNDGKVPFVFQGPWLISEIDKSVDWGVALLPELEPGKPLKPFLGSEALLLAKPTQVRDQALAVADYLTSDEAALSRLQAGRQMVANAKVYENPRLLEDPVVKVFRAQADQALPMSASAEAGVAWNPYNTALRKAIFGDSDVGAALAEAQKAAAEALAQLGK